MTIWITVTDAVTGTGAIAAVVSPFWLPLLHTTSEIAALLLPVFGTIWLAVQIGLKLWTHYKRHGP